jgi:hypothetical protein
MTPIVARLRCWSRSGHDRRDRQAPKANSRASRGAKQIAIAERRINVFSSIHASLVAQGLELHCFCSQIIAAPGRIRRRKSPILICLDRASSGTASGERRLDSPAVIGPVQELLALARPAHRIARLAMSSDLRHVALDSLPASDLAGVLVGQPPAHVVAAIPLEPAARIVRMHPALPSPLRQGLAGVHAEIVQGAVAAGGRELGANQLAGYSSRQSVRYLPQNTPSSSICFGVRSGRKCGSKSRPTDADSS